MATLTDTDLLIERLEKQLSAVGVMESSDEVFDRIINQTGLCYVQQSGRYGMLRSEGSYHLVADKNIHGLLNNLGCIPDYLDEKEARFFINDLVSRVIYKRSVDGMLNLAGYPCGIIQLPSGKPLLVPEGFKTIKPEKGDPEPVLKLIRSLFGKNEKAETTFLGWLQRFAMDAQTCQESGPRNLRQSQLMLIVGPPGGGKSLLAGLVAQVAGGTVEHPYSYFVGDTTFNGELGSAVLLLMDDQAESVLPKARNRLTQRIKEYLVSNEVRIHPKGFQAFTAKLFQRMIMLSNRDQLHTLPMMDPSFLDKVHVLAAHNSEWVSMSRTDPEREKWKKQLDEAFPALVYHLLYEWKLPDDMADSRFGIKAYHDPDLLAEIRDEESNDTVLDMISQYLSSKSLKEIEAEIRGIGKLERAISDIGSAEFHWRGRACEFENLALAAGCPHTFFKHKIAAGKLLRELADQHSEAVGCTGKINGINRWSINFGQLTTPKALPNSKSETSRAPNRISLDDD